MAASAPIAEVESFPGRRSADIVRWFAESFGIVAIAGVLALVFGLSSSVYLASGNIRNIFIQISVVGVAAIGETMVMLVGGLDLSVGSVILLSEVISADLTATHNFPVGLALVVALLAASGIGLLNGILTAVIGIAPILATLGTLLVAAGFGELILGIRYLQVTNPLFNQLAETNVLFNLPIMVAVTFALYIVAAVVMRKTPFGRMVYAIGGNRNAARLSGLPVTRVTIAVYTLGGLFAGVAGFLNVAQIGLVSQTDGVGLQFQAIIAVLLGGLSITAGGVGRVERTLIGALIIGMITNYETIKGLDPSFQMAFLGGLLLLAILVDRGLRGRR